MFNKIIKLGQRKVFNKSDNNHHETSNSVTVNHASRISTGGITNPLLPAPESTLTSPQPSPTPQRFALSGPPPSIEVLPLLKDVSASDRPLLFIRKAQMCCCSCDFSDTLKMPREKEIKRQTLIELVDYIQSGSSKVNETMQGELIKMISANIFRCLPPAYHENSSTPEGADPDEEEPSLDPSWPHLQLIYELLLRYVVSSEIEPKIAKRYINHTFVLRLLDMFDSEDPREREYLKTAVHRIYGKFMVHRPFIRSSISNIFYRFAYETERYYGIGELLEILGSVINGFTVPMKEEHRIFLVKALLPLHKAKCLSGYHQQLSYCVTQFVEKDYKLADTVIRSLLKYWPLTNCQKEVLFIGELEEVLDVTQGSEFRLCMVPLFRQIGRCLNSPHFQVAERALFLWNNEHIVGLIAQNRDVIFPIIFEALEKNMKGHWNQAVHGLSANVRRMFLEMDAELFEECQKEFSEKEARAWELEEQRALTWKRLEEVAAESG